MRRAPRDWLPWAALVAGLAVAALVAGRPNPGGPPLDPRSTGPSGTKALMDSLRALGAQVSVQADLPAAGDGTALVLVDDLDDARRAALLRWVESGGTLVLTDPLSELTSARPSGTAGFGSAAPELLAGCRLAALERVERVYVPGAVLLEPPPGATACFPGGLRSWMVVEERGRGNLVVLGGAGAFTNGNLGRADNGVLAVALLAPGGPCRVVVVEPPGPGEGRKGLAELVEPRVELALVQLVVAFVVVALVAGRRLGRPVAEPQAVEIPGSELVLAVGQLLQRSRSRDRAAAILREDLNRTVAERMGLPAGTPPATVAELVQARSSLPAADVEQALLGGAPESEESLVTMARAVETVRREVSGLGAR